MLFLSLEFGKQGQPALTTKVPLLLATDQRAYYVDWARLPGPIKNLFRRRIARMDASDKEAAVLQHSNSCPRAESMKRVSSPVFTSANQTSSS
jgi:hypothetical protein